MFMQNGSIYEVLQIKSIDLYSSSKYYSVVGDK